MAPAGSAVLVGAASGGVGSGGFGLEAVRQLASVADVNRLLHEASARERAIDTELEQLLFKRSELEQCLVELHLSTEEVRAEGQLPELIASRPLSWRSSSLC